MGAPKPPAGLEFVTNWTDKEYDTAATIVMNPGKASPAGIEKARAAMDWYDANMRGGSAAPSGDADDASDETIEIGDAVLREPAAAEAEPNPLSPTYYDAHPLATLAQRASPPPARALTHYDPDFGSEAPRTVGRGMGGRTMNEALAQYQRGNPGFVPSGDASTVALDITPELENSPYLVGAENPFGGGSRAAGFGAMLQADEPAAVDPRQPFPEGAQPRSLGRTASAPLDPRSPYQIGRDTEGARQAAAYEEDPGAYRGGQAITELMATAPAAAIPAGEALSIGRQLLTTAGTAGGYGAVSGALQSAPDAGPLTMAGDAALGGLTGAGIGLVTHGLANAPRAVPMVAPAAVMGGIYGAATAEGKPAQSGSGKPAGPPTMGDRLANAGLYALGGAGVAGLGAAVLPHVPPATLAAARSTANRAALPRAERALAALADRASELRSGAGGIYGAAVADLAESRGTDPRTAMIELGDEIERLKIHERKPGGSIIPSPRRYEENARGVMGEAGPKVEDSLREAVDQGVTYPRDKIVKSLRSLAGKGRANTASLKSRRRAIRGLAEEEAAVPAQVAPKVKANATSLTRKAKAAAGDAKAAERRAGTSTKAMEKADRLAERAKALEGKAQGAKKKAAAVLKVEKLEKAAQTATGARAEKIADQLETARAQAPGAQMDPMKLWRLKKTYEGEAGFRRGKLNAGDSIKEAAHLEAARVPRRALYQSMRTLAEKESTLPKFEGGMRDYETGATVATASGKRVAHGMGNNPLTLSGSSTGNPWYGAFVQGFNQMGGRHAMANALRSIQESAARAPRGLPVGPAALGSPASQAAQSAVGAPPAAPPPPTPAAAPRPTPAVPPAPVPAPRPKTDPGKGNGSQLPNKIREALGQGMDFGRFSAPLLDAFDTGDEAAINAAVARATDDPDFQRNYLPYLVDETR